jgi:hypothetical protein
MIFKLPNVNVLKINSYNNLGSQMFNKIDHNHHIKEHINNQGT